jgi:predicted metalloprotease
VLPRWVETLSKEAGVPDPNDPWKCLDTPPVRGRDIGICRDLLRLDAGGVTQRDTNEVVEIVGSAEPVLKGIWAETFRRADRTFNPPRVDYYGIASRNSLEQLTKSSRCPRPLENALYCPIENAIYYDAIFMATLRASVSAQTMTPGRYAVIAAAAHEMGHTASIATGASRGDEQVEELIADCFAGATVKAFSDIEAGGSKTVQITRALRPLDEGRMAMYIIGQRSTSGGAHAGPEVRRAIFTAGFNKGVGACAPDAFR